MGAAGEPVRRLPDDLHARGARIRLIACLAWYDEPVEWLAELVASLAPHVDHLVAVDGAYALLPGGKAHSPSDQARVLVGACAGAGIGLTLHQPEARWLHNETEKRTALFALAHAVARPGDWLWVIDADEVVIQAPDLRASLATSTCEVAEVLLGTDDVGWSPARRLFRAQRDGIAVIGQHYFYVGDDDRCLWGAGSDSETPEQLHGVRVLHRPRPLGSRRMRQEEYYARRDKLGVERDVVSVP